MIKRFTSINQFLLEGLEEQLTGGKDAQRLTFQRLDLKSKLSFSMIKLWNSIIKELDTGRSVNFSPGSKIDLELKAFQQASREIYQQFGEGNTYEHAGLFERWGETLGRFFSSQMIIGSNVSRSELKATFERFWDNFFMLQGISHQQENNLDQTSAAKEQFVKYNLDILKDYIRNIVLAEERPSKSLPTDDTEKDNSTTPKDQEPERQDGFIFPIEQPSDNSSSLHPGPYAEPLKHLVKERLHPRNTMLVSEKEASAIAEKVTDKIIGGLLSALTDIVISETSGNTLFKLKHLGKIDLSKIRTEKGIEYTILLLSISYCTSTLIQSIGYSWLLYRMLEHEIPHTAGLKKYWEELSEAAQSILQQSPSLHQFQKDQEESASEAAYPTLAAYFASHPFWDDPESPYCITGLQLSPIDWELQTGRVDSAQTNGNIDLFLDQAQHREALDALILAAGFGQKVMQTHAALVRKAILALLEQKDNAGMGWVDDLMLAVGKIPKWAGNDTAAFIDEALRIIKDTVNMYYPFVHTAIQELDMLVGYMRSGEYDWDALEVNKLMQDRASRFIGPSYIYFIAPETKQLLAVTTAMDLTLRLKDHPLDVAENISRSFAIQYARMIVRLLKHYPSFPRKAEIDLLATYNREEFDEPVAKDMVQKIQGKIEKYLTKVLYLQIKFEFSQYVSMQKEKYQGSGNAPTIDQVLNEFYQLTIEILDRHNRYRL